MLGKFWVYFQLLLFIINQFFFLHFEQFFVVTFDGSFVHYICTFPSSHHFVFDMFFGTICLPTNVWKLGVGSSWLFPYFTDHLGSFFFFSCTCSSYLFLLPDDHHFLFLSLFRLDHHNPFSICFAYYGVNFFLTFYSLLFSFKMRFLSTILT